MKYLVLLASLIFASCSPKVSNLVGIYGVREPFEYLITSPISLDGKTLVKLMYNTCPNGFTIEKDINDRELRLIYFRCNVRN